MLGGQIDRRTFRRHLGAAQFLINLCRGEPAIGNMIHSVRRRQSVFAVDYSATVLVEHFFAFVLLLFLLHFLLFFVAHCRPVHHALFKPLVRKTYKANSIHTLPNNRDAHRQNQHPRSTVGSAWESCHFWPNWHRSRSETYASLGRSFVAVPMSAKATTGCGNHLHKQAVYISRMPHFHKSDACRHFDFQKCHLLSRMKSSHCHWNCDPHRKACLFKAYPIATAIPSRLAMLATIKIYSEISKR